jgi:hypothetical protein
VPACVSDPNPLSLRCSEPHPNICSPAGVATPWTGYPSGDITDAQSTRGCDREADAQKTAMTLPPPAENGNPQEDLVSTFEPVPRPAATATGRETPRWTRTVPCIQGHELMVWRSTVAALLGLSIIGMAVGSPVPAVWAFLLAIPAMIIAEGQAPWWVRTRRRKQAAA